MNGRVIVKAQSGTESAFSRWIDWLFLGAMVCGLLLVLRAVGGLSFSVLAACLPVVGISGLLWGAHCLGKGWLTGCFLLLTGVSLGWFCLSEGLRSRLWQVFRSLSGGAGQGIEATEAAAFLAVVLTLAAFLLEAACRMHWPLFLLTTFLMLSAPVFGISLDAAAVFLFLLFQMLFWTLQGMEREPAAAGPAGKRSGRWLRGFLVLILSGAFLLAWLAVSWQGDAFYQAAYTAEGYVQRTFRQASGIVDEPDSGRLNRGNLYPAGTKQLEIISNTQPTETIYLKGFSGGEYQDGVWLPADDNTVFRRMDEHTLHWDGQWNGWIAGMVDSMPFMMNQSMRSAGELPERTLQVWQDGEAGGEQYTPYFSSQRRGTQETNDQGQAGYFYRYYQLQELQIDWNQVEGGQEILADWYQAIHFAYLIEAEDFYTTVPAEALPRLTQLCEENPLEGVEEITAFIIATLHDTAVYTRTPGLFPMNEDPVEYFLFDNRQGYCQHFASAAVLMYRMYGIPARYATGYAASPSDFSEQPDGSYRAVLTDASAHAWPEIFLENYGWVPVEVTPSGYDSSASYSGMDSALLEDLLAERQGNAAIPDEEETPDSPKPSVDGAQDLPLELPGGEAMATGIVLLLLFLLAAFVIYRASRLRAQEQMGIRELFARLVEALHSAGLLADCDGSEADFPSRLSEAVEGLSRQDAERLCRMAERAAFSAKEPDAGEIAECRRLYRRIIRLMVRRMPWWRLLYFRYGKQFC